MSEATGEIHYFPDDEEMKHNMLTRMHVFNVRINSGMGREGGGLCTNNRHKELVMGSKTGKISTIN